jgi:hypothetical protein
MFMAVTNNGSCHVVGWGNEGAVKVAANLRKMPHKTALSACHLALIVNSASTLHNKIGMFSGRLR